MEIEEPVAADRRRKSLAIDIETYEMLREICARERRTLISQLQLMIEDRYDELFDKYRKDRH